MFAVPGWSLGDIKREAETPKTKSTKSDSSKKRKRKHAEGAVETQRPGNLTPNATIPQPSDGFKRQKQTHREVRPKGEVRPSARTSDIREGQPAEKHDGQPKSSSKKTEKRRKQREEAQQRKDPGSRVSTTPATLDPLPSASDSKLTPLQTVMRQKLAGARFRHLNETLYTSPSTKALALFEANPTFFDEYHSGFRQQVSTWPENPVSSFLEDLKRRGKSRSFGKDEQGDSRTQALPRNNGVCAIADMGCGDAALAQQLEVNAKKLSIKVSSYDLHGNSNYVTKADIANLPASDGSFNVAILCLALMGTNWIDFIEEAWRILHWKGELWVAEIKSRFQAPKRKQVVDHSVGKRRKGSKASGKDDAEKDEAQMTQVEDSKGSSDGTDVSAFVEVLRSRGFLLQREGGIDVHNKMFVKMRFLKGLVPSKGRHAGKGQPPGKQAQRLPARPVSTDDSGIDEAAVLKPCLYKVR